MEDQVRTEIVRFIRESPLNRFPDSSEPYFNEPLIGFAAADDQLFIEYKNIIGTFHQTPQEVMKYSPGNGTAASVICWILPVTQSTRKSNRNEEQFPSQAWAQTRFFGEQLNGMLRRHIVTWLEEQGHGAIAPQYAASWKEFTDTPVGIASTWSERHAAYAAGLGTFSLNDALITPKGIAHRCGSVITDLPLAPSPRIYPGHHSNCLYFQDGSCGLCIARCPVGALSQNGHDKLKCRLHVYTTSVEAVAERFGTPQVGCGLCQTRVPCEAGIPRGGTPVP